MGFFNESEVIRRAPLSLLPACGTCGLFKGCRSPKMPVAGDGRREILVVGEAPGATEDRKGTPFVGKTGKFLARVLDSEGIDLYRDCWLTNAAICRPPGNKLPPQAVVHCRPNVVAAVRELNPRVILLLGKSALESVMGWVWRENCGPITRWIGWTIPHQKLNAWICPMWHPSFVMRNEWDKVPENTFRRHVAAASELTERPWRTPPDYDAKIRRVADPVEAARLVGEVAASGLPMAFDYETDRLKPDAVGARILCCAVSNGRLSVAYPWVGEAREATRVFLTSRVPKLGHNAKFEERWTRAEFGVGVVNWEHDGMLGAHVLDNREGITGLKFQALVRFGVEPYDQDLKPFMESADSNSPNRLARGVSLDRLLLYCGKDALLEWLVCREQMRELGTWRY